MRPLPRRACLLLSIATIAAAQPCDDGHWSHDFPHGTIYGTLDAVTTFGEPPRVVVGGEFEFATDQGWYFGQNLASWNGTLWERIGDMDPDLKVNCFLTWDDPKNPDGSCLYVGGQYVTLNDTTFRRIAKWDGAAWSPLASGFRGPPIVGASVHAMAVYDDGTGPALYAGGFFTKTGDQQTPLANIARWDGQNWHDVGGGVTLKNVPSIEHDGVASMVVFDDGSGPALYVGGKFIAAGDKPLQCLARWNGLEWSAVAPPLQPPDGHPDAEISVFAISAFDDGSGPALWVAGYFRAPGVPVDWLARVRNGQWESAGELFGHNSGWEYFPWVRTFVVHDYEGVPALHAGGSFETSPPEPEDETGGCVARWDAAAQRWIDREAATEVMALASQDDQTGERLWAAGNFRYAGSDPNKRIASLDAEGWHRVGDFMPSLASGITAFDDGSGPAVYLTGDFESIGDLGWCYGIARYDQSGWSTVGDWTDIPGMESAALDKPYVLDMGNGASLYSFARLYRQGAFAFQGVVRWDGAHWSTVGQDLRQDVGSLFVYDEGAGPRIFAMPGAAMPGDDPQILVLKEGTWTEWSSGKGYLARAALSFDDGSGPALWVGGNFSEWEGVASPNMVRYRPDSGWEAVGSGTDDAVLSLVTWDRGAGPELYIAGAFTTANGAVVNRVARWDGTAWQALGSGLAGGINGQGAALLTVWDDGAGSALYACGLFNKAGGEPARHIAKWNGEQWSALGQGTLGAISDAVGLTLDREPTLFVCGNLGFAEKYPSPSVAAWISCSCPADLDASGSLDLFDFLTFLNLFNAQDPTADCDADGAFTITDFACYSALFAAGCP